jgi:hypothetical protein
VDVDQLVESEQVRHVLVNRLRVDSLVAQREVVREITCADGL